MCGGYFARGAMRGPLLPPSGGCVPRRSPEAATPCVSPPRPFPLPAVFGRSAEGGAFSSGSAGMERGLLYQSQRVDGGARERGWAGGYLSKFLKNYTLHTLLLVWLFGGSWGQEGLLKYSVWVVSFACFSCEKLLTVEVPEQDPPGHWGALATQPASRDGFLAPASLAIVSQWILFSITCPSLDPRSCPPAWVKTTILTR